MLFRSIEIFPFAIHNVRSNDNHDLFLVKCLATALKGVSDERKVHEIGNALVILSRHIADQPAKNGRVPVTDDHGRFHHGAVHDGNFVGNFLGTGDRRHNPHEGVDVSGLLSGKTYYYRLRAVDPQGTNQTNSNNITVLTVPAAPAVGGKIGRAHV